MGTHEVNWRKLLLLILGLVVMIAAAMRLMMASYVLTPGIELYQNQLFLPAQNEYFKLEGKPYSPEWRVIGLMRETRENLKKDIDPYLSNPSIQNADKSITLSGMTLSDPVLLKKSATDVFVMQPSDLQPEPIFLSHWQELNQFFQRQSDLYQFIHDTLHSPHQTELFWLMSSGHLVHADVDQSVMGLVRTPFFLYMALFVFILAVAILSWLYASHRLAAFYFVVMGVSLALMAWSEGIYVNRGLVLSGDVFRILSSLNVLGLTFFIAALTSFVGVYPKRVCRYPDVFVMIGILIFSLMFFEMLPGEWLGNCLLWSGYLIMMVFLMIRQAFQVRQDPVARFQLHWVFLSLVLGGIVLITVAYWPYLLGITETIQPLYGLMGLFVTYLLLSISLAYARLLEINAWWSKLWYFSLWGFFAIAVTSVLLMSTGMNMSVAILVGLAISGWMALPLRRWFWHKTQGLQGQRQEIHEIVPKLVGADLSSLEKTFKESVLARLRPIRQEWVSVTANAISINSDASEMVIPTLCGHGHYVLGLPENGQRLYLKEDREWVKHLYDVTKSIEVLFRQKEQGVQVERQRIRRDLHDDMTQEIISLIRHADTEDVRKKAQEMMQSLKNVLSALASETTALEDWLSQSQGVMREMLSDQGFELKWRQQLMDGRTSLSPRQVSNLNKILREAISNLLKYAARGQIRVNVRQFEHSLEIHIDNAVAQTNESYDSNHLGLPNMKKRAEELGGYIYTLHLNAEFKLLVSIPLSRREEAYL